MDEAMVDLVAELSAKCAAYELILIDLLFSTFPLEVHRNERRESTCHALERQIVGLDSASHEYLYLQRVLATIEALYDTPGPPSAAQKP